jgi:cobalt-precorrin 5A hydrolase
MAFITYSAAELMQVKGDSLASSEFVLKTTGADNVCERAALCACGENAQLISPRTAGKGVTVALAKSTKEYFFD